MAEEPKGNPDLASELLSSPDVLWYKQNKVNFERLDAIEADIKMQLKDLTLDDAEQEKLLKVVSKSVHGIKFDTLEYFRIIVTAENSLRQNRLRMEAWEYQDLAKNYDSKRRIIHNSLID